MPVMDLTLQSQRYRRQGRILGIISMFAYAIGLLALVLHFGFRASGYFLLGLYIVEAFVLVWFVAHTALLLLWSNNRLAQLRSQWYDWLLVVGVSLVLVTALFMELENQTLVIGTIIEAGMSLALLLRAIELTRLVTQSRFQPAQILVGSFMVLIIVGTMVLMLPASRSQLITVLDENSPAGLRVIEGNVYRDLGDEAIIQTGMGNLIVPWDEVEDVRTAPPARWNVALFTSTSAVCVTGLVVESTGSHWSQFGQAVILVLIQIGGLGIMTFGSVFALVLFQNLNLRQNAVMTDLMSPSLSVSIGRVLVFIILTTLLVEAIGARLMWSLWSEPGMDFWQRMWFSSFHAVSAFCNAGFSLYDNSLMRYADTWQANIAFPGLIILGGLGFFVGYNLLRVSKAFVRRSWAVMRRRQPPPLMDRRRLTLQSKIVLTMTLILLISGTGLFLLFETLPNLQPAEEGQVVHEMSTVNMAQRAVRSWFLSVTSRTAGFNTTDTGSLTASSKFLTILQMFIGAGPGSPAGGVKVTTLAVVMFGVASMLTSRPTPHAFKRQISQNILLRALVIIMLGAAIVAISTMVIVSLQPEFDFLDVLFESTSAFGTVGLSTGVTPSLNLWSRLVVVVVMFAGRVGPLTLFIALPLGGRGVDYEYATESVAIG